ncbi:centrosomal protein of 128 kDa isoform X2 [Tiliqua scincoides]|uniref:centrosomal protein of 128 kDa isoform X2 n=1 Tax=Tiliqua scincoides TaxID=71010 RepID=UPI003461F949
MADSSSDSDHFRHRLGRRGPLRATCSRIRNRGTEDVTEKIQTLASTLQDTNRNLKHVDQMLGQYREYNNEQAEAIANLKETLEQSIGQLRSQRLSRHSGVRSASLSSLYASDLDGGAPESRQFKPTSPLRDYGETLGTRSRRSRSAVRFADRGDNLDQLHSLHQTFRDLGSGQMRLEDDLSREVSRRNRIDAETKRMLEDLSDKLSESQKQEMVSERVERRLQEIEREIRAERQLVERRQDQLGHVSMHLQEALQQQDAKANEVELVLKNKLLKTEGEKNKLEQELEHSRRKLDHSENSREALHHQIEDLRSQLLRAEEERLNLQHQISQVAIHHQNHPDDQEDDKRKRRVGERSDQEKQEMEKEIWELRAKLSHSAVMSEIEELKRCIERKDKERTQLGMQIEVLREKDDLKGQLLSAVHQMENLQKELSDALEKRAKQEEELCRKETKLCETRSIQMDLEQEIRHVRETADKLESELQKQSLMHSQLRTDKQCLEEELANINVLHEKDQARLLEMQAVIKNLSAVRADLTHRVAEEEKAKKEMCKSLTDLQKEQKSSQEEMEAASNQLKLERDVHQQELAELQSELQRLKTKHNEHIQELRKLCSQEKEEAVGHIEMLKAELVEDRNLVKAQRRQVEKIKIECDKLTEQLTHKEEENAILRRKYQLMKQELDEKNKRINSEDDHVKRIEEDRLQLQDALCRLQTEQESILSMIGNEIDAACEVFSRDLVEKLKAISVTPGIQNDPHRWLAETKTKLQWLCEEVRERETKEKKLRRQLQQSREQLKHLTLNKETQCQTLLGQIAKQEQLLDEVYQEKKDLMQKTLRKEEEIVSLQERLTALEMSTQVALNHLESVPEKLNLLEDFRDLGNFRSQMDILEERYSKYKEIMGSLHQDLEESKRRLEDFRDKKTGANISPICSASSNWRSNPSFMSSSLLSNSGSFTKSTLPLDLNAAKKDAISVTVNGMKHRTEK